MILFVLQNKDVGQALQDQEKAGRYVAAVCAGMLCLHVRVCTNKRVHALICIHAQTRTHTHTHEFIITQHAHSCMFILQCILQTISH